MSGSGASWTANWRCWWEPIGLALAAVLAVGIGLLPLMWAVVFLLGAAAVLGTLARPQLGVLLVALAVPFGSLRQIHIGLISVGITEFLVALVLASWVMRMLARRELGVDWPPLTLPLVLFVIVLDVSSLESMSLQRSVKEIIKWLEVLALYVLVSNEMGGRWRTALVFALLGSGALAAVQGIYQFLSQIGPEEFILFGRFMRAYGTFEQPNPYGGYLGLTLPLALGLVFAGILPMKKRVSSRWLVWAGGTGALMLLALVMSWSRGAWLGIAAAVGAMVVAIAARSGRAVVLVVVLAVLLGYILLLGGGALLPASIMQRFADFAPYLGVTDVRGLEVTDANFAVLERMAHWQSALAMWTAHPWLGVGIGNYEVAYAQYALPQWGAPLGHAHNYYLNIGAEAGAVGLLSYLLLWGAALLQGWRAVRERWDWDWGVAIGALGVLVHLSVHNVFDNLFVHAMYLQVAIILGLIAIGRTAASRSGIDRARRRPRSLGGLP